MSDNRAERVCLCRGKFLELARVGTWEFVERIRGRTPVGIVAMTAERRVILISQFRVPVGKVIVEIPAGLVGDSAGNEEEAWETAAKRELLEETGYSAERVEMLSEGPTSAGLTSECIMLVRATGLVKHGGPTPDGEEDITVHEVGLEEAGGVVKGAGGGGDDGGSEGVCGVVFFEEIKMQAGRLRYVTGLALVVPVM